MSIDIFLHFFLGYRYIEKCLVNYKVLYWFQIIIILSGIWQLEDAQKVKNQEIAKELSLPPVKLHCSSKSLILHILGEQIVNITVLRNFWAKNVS